MKQRSNIGRAMARTAVLALLMVAAPVVRADADSEREQLARIANEIVRLQALVQQAAREADTKARVRFEYAWLTRDLELVRRGVEDHLDAPRQPRPVTPLTGDYRR